MSPIEKVYVTPYHKEPEFVKVPKGAINEQGVKQKRKAIKFHPNHRGVGQFKTSDPKIQSFLEEHQNFKSGKIVLVGESNMVKDVPKENEAEKPDPANMADKPKNKKK